MMDYKIEYHYKQHYDSLDDLIELPEQTLNEYDLCTVEYSSSRRVIYYYNPTLKDLAKD